LALLALCLCVPCALGEGASIQIKKQKARTQFETAERMREELNGLPQKDRTRREYQRVMDAYRRVYYTAPTSSKADASVVAVAELLAECGRAFNDEKLLRNAISQYEFLRREYPGSKYRFDALFTIGQIYKDDLEEMDKAREAFQEVIRRYPHLQLAADAREALSEMDAQAHAKPKPRERAPEAEAATRAQEDHAESKPAENSGEGQHGLQLVTGIRHWSTPDYTRVAIDLEQEVKYEAGRVPNPDRIFFDLLDSKLASTLAGKSFEVSDGFLRRVRVAQFQKGRVRVVLEVDAVSDYSAFLLPNPYRLIIDIHGRRTGAPTTQVAKVQPEPLPLPEAPAPAPEADKASKAAEPPPTVAEAPANAPQSQPVFADQTSPTADPNPAEVKAVPEFGPKMVTGSFNSQGRTVTSNESSFPSASRAGSKSSSQETNASAQPSAAVPHPAAEAPQSAAVQASTKSEIANLDGHEVKATEKPTSEPTVQVVAPRAPETKGMLTGKRASSVPQGHQATPTADGQRSLIRALGLKVGRIVIDAGHGGHDTGTIGPNGLLEKDLVLDVSLRLGRLLQSKLGADVIYTRDDDTFIPLETRTAIANQQEADLFISVHANSSSDPSARGVETYYLNFNPSPDALEVAARENAVSEKSVHELSDLVKKITLKDKVEESREFATDVQHSLYQGLVGKDAGKSTLRDRGVKKAPFIVLIGANMPSILAEISFVSNPADERKLQTPEYRQKIAESLYRGISRYVNGLSGVKVAKAGAGEGE
jgi:N-acetylmuramoyl-L-alanine amidase